MHCAHSSKLDTALEDCLERHLHLHNVAKPEWGLMCTFYQILQEGWSSFKCGMGRYFHEFKLKCFIFYIEEMNAAEQLMILRLIQNVVRSFHDHLLPKVFCTPSRWDGGIQAILPVSCSLLYHTDTLGKDGGKKEKNNWKSLLQEW